VSFRAKASAFALGAVACMLLAPAAMASSRGPVQFTGRQLKAALLPASDFVPGYTAALEADSGRRLEHVSLFTVRSMSCPDFWFFIRESYGFGETAFATDVVSNPT
jgi:hypothetical protein